MKYLTFFLILFIGFSLTVPAVLAQGGDGGVGGGSGVDLINPIESDSIMEIVNSIILTLRNRIAPPLFAIMVLVGAFQMLFAAGKPEKFEIGKKTVVYAIIGYAIIFIASGISSLINNILSA